jgi:glycosyltransferase involved in cell wall biosynthesis
MATAPKHIAIDARMLSTSTGRYIERLLHHLQQIDATNTYSVLLLTKDLSAWAPSSPNFHKVEANFPVYSLREQLGFAWFLYQLNADLVHFTMPQHPLLYSRAHILTVHDLTLVDFVNRRHQNPLSDFYKNLIKPAAFKFLMNMGVNGAQHIITGSDYVKHQLTARYKLSESKITRSYLAAEPVIAKPKPYPPLQGKRFIICVGNAYPYKNLRALIEAFQAAELADDDAFLVLVGKTEYYYRELADFVKRETIKNILFTGFVDDAELAWMYEHAQLYVNPSLSEGFGLGGMEALRVGLPLASSTATCLPEVYGDAAAYFNPRNASEMATVITKTLGDKKLLSRLKAAGPKRAGQFSWRRTAEETKAVYNRVLEDNS